MGAFETNITNIYGKLGEKWLSDLPHIVDDIGIHYSITALTPLTVDKLTYHYVLSGIKDKRPVILKIGLDKSSLERESKALISFEGYGAVKLIETNNNFLLLERIIPGDALKNSWIEREEEATEIAAALMHRLHASPPLNYSSFPTIIDWLSSLDRDIKRNIPKNYIEKALNLRHKLLNTCSKFTLLHGDFHHNNILKSHDEWVAIDPKGVIGEPAYEAAYFMRNPMPDLITIHYEQALQIITSRSKFFAQSLGTTEMRLLEWCFVQSVLGWLWALEDGVDFINFRNLTEIFDSLV